MEPLVVTAFCRRSCAVGYVVDSFSLLLRGFARSNAGKEKAMRDVSSSNKGQPANPDSIDTGTSKAAPIVVALILTAIVGCADRNPDEHFSQRTTLGMNRSELLQKLQSGKRVGGKNVDIDFILDNGRRVPYLSAEYRLGDTCVYTSDELRELGYSEGKRMPDAYFVSRIWRWSPGYGALQSYEYSFDDRGVVQEVVVFYHDEGDPWLQAVVGFYWLGSALSAAALLCTYRGTMQHWLAKTPRKSQRRLYLAVFRDFGVALFAGMVGIWATALAVDWESVPGVTVIALPLAASLVVYYVTLMLTRSRVWSLCAFFALPVLVAALCIARPVSHSQTVTRAAAVLENTGSSRYHERAGVSKKSTLGSVINPSVRNSFQETPECYTSVSTSTRVN